MPEDSPVSECRLVRRLKESEEIFAQIEHWTGSELRLQRLLRTDYPDDVVRAALTLHELRVRASTRFSRASGMWFDRVGLEQATSESVARHKAQRFTGTVMDFCSGIGGDSIALAESCDVVAIDRNIASCLRLKLNTDVYGVRNRVRIICARAETVSPGDLPVHVDPDRRSGRRGRSLRIEDCRPDLSFLREMIRTARGGAIKLSPASNFPGKFDDVEIELVSLHGECREATIWFGELAGSATYRATLLPSGESISGDPLESPTHVGQPGRFVYDPDPAVVRAGLVDRLVEQLGFRRLDSAEEYLTSDELIASSFVQAFEVLANLPTSDREVRQWIRRSNIGQVEIKCRHIRVAMESYRRRLPLSGRDSAVIIVARIAGRARTLVCRRVAGQPGVV